MSKILINDEFTIEGQFSMEAVYDIKSNPPIVNIRGVLTSDKGYLPLINSLENERYRITGVNVYQETYGSEEDMIAYHFSAKSFAIADRLREVKQN